MLVFVSQYPIQIHLAFFIVLQPEVEYRRFIQDDQLVVFVNVVNAVFDFEEIAVERMCMSLVVPFEEAFVEGLYRQAS
jgi:hypothetical protein